MRCVSSYQLTAATVVDQWLWIRLSGYFYESFIPDCLLPVIESFKIVLKIVCKKVKSVIQLKALVSQAQITVFIMLIWINI